MCNPSHGLFGELKTYLNIGMFALGAKLCLSQLYESQLTTAAIVHNGVVHCSSFSSV